MKRRSLAFWSVGIGTLRVVLGMSYAFGQGGIVDGFNQDATKVAFLSTELQRMSSEPTPVVSVIPSPPTAVPGPTPYFSDATPTGEGMILPYGPGQPIRGLDLGTTWRSSWGEDADQAYAGCLQEDPTQGVIVVESVPNEQGVRSHEVHNLPAGTGKISVIAAMSGVLTLQAGQGQLFEFDTQTQKNYCATTLALREKSPCGRSRMWFYAKHRIGPGQLTTTGEIIKLSLGAK